MLCIMDVKTFGGVYQLSYNYLHLSYHCFCVCQTLLLRRLYVFCFKYSLSALDNEDCVKLIMYYVDHQYCCF